SYRRSAEGLAYLNQAFEESEENSTEVELAQKKLNFVRTLSGGGLEEEARRIIQEARRRYPDELEEALAVAVLDLFLEYGPADSLEAAYRAYKKFFPTSEVYGESPNDHFYLARIHEERGEWREAIDRWLVRKESGSTDKSFGMSIGPCYRELGEYDRAIEYIHESLVYYPNGPRTNLQMALTYEAMGRNEEARAHLKKTLIWYADAGPQHPRARLARELAERIGLEY
ncbi:MAG: tetratricopeptide repeat protein, partial [Gemmatimonadetes bacterium]|nr:tetratricopeptide repeat protein [Gemmatimonadota bacterium]